jgi:hypothetical protein
MAASARCAAPGGFLQSMRLRSSVKFRSFERTAERDVTHGFRFRAAAVLSPGTREA